jgi:hypothetical protein
MKITWEDISTNIVYSKLTGVEPNPIFKEIYDLLKYWIPSIIEDTSITINGQRSYIYKSKNKVLYMYNDTWDIFKHKYGMGYFDTQDLINKYVINTHNIDVNQSTIFLDI